MHALSVVLLALASTLLPGAWAFTGGAPSGACNRIYPEGHAGPSQNLTTIPFALDISPLNGGYSPEQTYTLTLASTVSGQIYRGLLVQARTTAEGSPVGSFQALSGVTRLSSCTPQESAITHINSNVKTSTNLTWTAPATGTGPIEFLWAVVEQNSGGVSRFWATVRSATVNERLPPLTVTFSGDTPMVTNSNNSVTAQITVSRPVPLQCQLVRRTGEQNPAIMHEQNCTSGLVTFSNVASGTYRLRVIAGDQEATIRSRVIFMSNKPNFCSLNVINEGIRSEVSSDGNISFVIEFRPIGRAVDYLCKIGFGTEEVFPCSSPVVLSGVVQPGGRTRLKIIPDPRECRRLDRKPLSLRLQAPSTDT